MTTTTAINLRKDGIVRFETSTNPDEIGMIEKVEQDTITIITPMGATHQLDRSECRNATKAMWNKVIDAIREEQSELESEQSAKPAKASKSTKQAKAESAALQQRIADATIRAEQAEIDAATEYSTEIVPNTGSDAAQMEAPATSIIPDLASDAAIAAITAMAGITATAMAKLDAAMPTTETLIIEANPASKTVISNEYKKSCKKAITADGRKSVNCGDAIAAKFEGMKLADIAKLAGEMLTAMGKPTTGELMLQQYSHLNLGMQRMNIVNRVRNAVKAQAIAVAAE